MFLAILNHLALLWSFNIAFVDYSLLFLPFGHRNTRKFLQTNTSLIFVCLHNQTFRLILGVILYSVNERSIFLSFPFVFLIKNTINFIRRETTKQKQKRNLTTVPELTTKIFGRKTQRNTQIFNLPLNTISYSTCKSIGLMWRYNQGEFHLL